MNRQSLSTKITFVFAISFVLVCILFMLLYKVQHEKILDLMQERQFQSMNYLLQLYRQQIPPQNVEAYFNSFGLKRVENKNLMSSVIDGGEVNFHRATLLGTFSSILYNGRYYLFIANPNVQILLESQDGKNSTDHLWIGFALALGVLITTYMSIMKSFKPLKALNESIKRFASGDMEIDCRIVGKDEIAEVANEFDKATKKIRNLIRSRQLFLRTIMHELKTPIGKGRIVSEMVQNDLQKSRLIDVFERLDLLLNEFSKIEQLVSQSYEINIQDYPLSSLIEQAIDTLMLDEEQIKKRVNLKIKDKIIQADFDLMSLAMKNLMDNAIKYSDNHFVHVSSIENGIRFKNSGKELSYPIEYYLDAFITSSKQDGRNMGLGLYIIKNILEYHNYTLQYTYQENSHNFDILWE